MCRSSEYAIKIQFYSRNLPFTKSAITAAMITLLRFSLSYKIEITYLKKVSWTVDRESFLSTDKMIWTTFYTVFTLWCAVSAGGKIFLYFYYNLLVGRARFWLENSDSRDFLMKSHIHVTQRSFHLSKFNSVKKSLSY